MAGSHHPPNDTDPNHVLTTPATPPPLDELFRAVGHPVRRQTLRFLVYTDGPQSVDDIAAAVTGEPTLDERSEHRQLCLSLTHQHLPRLEDIELIERTPHDLVVPTTATVDAVHVLDVAVGYFG